MARIGESGDLLKCSFCGKSQKEVKKLIAGPAVYICDECIQLCGEIIEEENEKTGGVLEPAGYEYTSGTAPKYQIYDYALEDEHIDFLYQNPSDALSLDSGTLFLLR